MNTFQSSIYKYALDRAKYKSIKTNRKLLFYLKQNSRNRSFIDEKWFGWLVLEPLLGFLLKKTCIVNQIGIEIEKVNIPSFSSWQE